MFRHSLGQTNSIGSMLNNISNMSKDFILTAEELYEDLCIKDDPTNIGNILIKMGFISSDDLDAIINNFKQLKEKKMLSEYLIEHTSLTIEQLEVALIYQQDIRRAAIKG